MENPCPLVQSHSIPPPQNLPRRASSSPGLSGGIHVSQPPHLAIAVASGSGEEACEVGNGVGIDNPATRTPAQRLRIRRQREAGLESSCLVRLPQGGHFTAPGRMKCCLVFASSGEARDKWRGRQMSGGRRGRGTTGPLVPTRPTHCRVCSVSVLWEYLLPSCSCVYEASPWHHNWQLVDCLIAHFLSDGN